MMARMRCSRFALLLALGAACDDGTRLLPEPGAELSELEPSAPGEPGEPAADPLEPAPPLQPEGMEPHSSTPSRPEQLQSDGAAAELPWTPGPPLRNPVSLPDAELAQQALGLLGSAAVGASGSCRSCHSLGRPTLTRWSQLTQELSGDCLAQPALAERADVDAMFECLRERSGKPAARFSAESFGIYAAGLHLPWFGFLFQHASSLQAGSSGAGPGGTTSQAELVARAGMPRAGQPWTQSEFDVVAEWFARRLPGLFELVPEDVGESCTPGLDPQLAAHVTELASSGWRARNAQVPLLMFGCGPGQSGSECLSELPRASSQAFASGWENVAGSQIRLLYDNSEAPSAFWSRCSADGRYVGSGLLSPAPGGYSGQILDLAESRLIAGDFAYDATFFPDNSGFLMQQGGYDDGSDITPTDGSALSEAVAMLCEQSVLGNSPELVTGQEPECTLVGGAFGLYQQTAKSVDGSDYWVAHGSYQSDNGGFAPVLRQPSAAFDNDSSTTLTTLLNTGNGFELGSAVRLATPHQGDPTLSPSGKLLVLRVKGQEFNTTVSGIDIVAAEQSGYALYAVEPAEDAGKSSASLRDLGRICLAGSKATFSYDERWLIFHRYVTAEDATELGFSGPDDPGFAEYLESGASDLILVDLLSGAAQRITSMQPGQYALFPHFRSDGWIYFVVRTIDGAEWFAASDAALVLER